ncbi:hypothetical protein H4R35_003435 [Dimargaris xerosporica]|nr:hypothetical protein H4R35_003435 [Dimargaris xerosporica]
MARRFRILVGATGSVASIKVPELVRLLHALENVEVQVVATPKALHFFDPQDVSPLCPVHTDQGEWATWAAKGDPVVHIELRKWADIIVVAPLDANTLAKVANGLCDNLLVRSLANGTVNVT